LGIDLNGDGVTANDNGDADTGANNLQNFPVLTSAVTQGSSTVVTGTLNSLASRTFRLEFFSMAVGNPSGFGEGGTFLGSVNATTDASGNASFTFIASTTVPGGQFISATATNLSTNDTSEFAQNVKIVGHGNLQFSAAAFSVAESAGRATITVTRSLGSDGVVTIQAATTGGTATAGADFTDASQTLTFVNGQTSLTFTIPILADTLVEGNETVNLTLSSPTGGASLGTPSTAVLTIIDVPPPVTQTTQTRGIVVARDRGIVVDLVNRKVGRNRKLFIRVFFADNGTLKTEFSSPFQNPTFRAIEALAIDSNGDGATDTVLLTANKGKKTVRLFLNF
jgi:hypothetical protein